MKAIVYYEYGSPDDVLVLKEIDEPAVKDDEVLVRVNAASVHAGDWLMLRGQPYIARLAFGLRKPKKNVAGTDVAGTVEAVGKDVKRFQPGDEVFGWCDGAFAEYACAEEDHFAAKPADLTFEQGAAVATSAIAALQALRDKGEVQPGQKVLIIGADRRRKPRSNWSRSATAPISSPGAVGSRAGQEANRESQRRCCRASA